MSSHLPPGRSHPHHDDRVEHPPHFLGPSRGHKVGLKPTKGWAQRNYHFWSRQVLPAILRKREVANGDVPAFECLDEDAIELVWIGHASFLIRTPVGNIVIDPNWALWHGPMKRTREPGLRLEQLPPIDLILVTHAHFDHLHRPSLRGIASGQPVLTPHGCGPLFRGLKVGLVQEMHEWSVFHWRGIEIIFTPSHHWGARFIHDTHRGFGGFLIRLPGNAIYHCGDSAYFPGFSEISKRFAVDTALLPIGAYEAPSGRDVHMNPEEAIQAFRDLGARKMIPMHYATFPLGGENLHDPLRRLMVAAEAEQLSDRVLAPREGEVVVLRNQ